MGFFNGVVDKYARAQVALRAMLNGSAAQDFAVKKLTASDTITPDAVKGIVGTVSADSAQAGSVGEVVESVVGATSSPPSGEWGDLTSIFLAAGHWEVSLVVVGYPNLAAGCSMMTGGMGTVSGNNNAGLVHGDTRAEWAASDQVIGFFAMPGKSVRLSAPATIFLKMYAIYSSGVPIFRGRITARRVR